MLFNSYAFLLVFLPAALAGFFILARSSRRFALAWLTAASLFFYGWWNPAYIPLILFSIILNYASGRLITRLGAGTSYARVALTAGIAANLILLGYYKYAGFFVSAADRWGGFGWPVLHVVLPLGISFFTFTQIAYLVDCHRGTAREYDFLQYALFVTFFPHLIAGPILHHGELIPQFSRRETFRFNVDAAAMGVTLFIIGLFKKVVFADRVAFAASPVFEAARDGLSITFFDAWAGVLAYSLQIYFDFSGYCDMAVGLGLLFGIRLPINFNSPYRAIDITDFWRRWHMTLSRFLRDYLYIPLGGNRKGSMRQFVNLILTMLLGGLWHGASWTFVFWGGLHGFYLCVHRGWQVIAGGGGRVSTAVMRALATAITFICVTLAWVFFRAEDMGSALRLVRAMGGGGGFVLPESMARLGTLPGVFYAYSTLWPGAPALAGIILLLGVALFLPNSQTLVGYVYGEDGSITPAARPHWSPTLPWSIAAGLATAIALASLSEPSQFLYFQF